MTSGDTILRKRLRKQLSLALGALHPGIFSFCLLHLLLFLLHLLLFVSIFFPFPFHSFFSWIFQTTSDFQDVTRMYQNRKKNVRVPFVPFNLWIRIREQKIRDRNRKGHHLVRRMLIKDSKSSVGTNFFPSLRNKFSFKNLIYLFSLLFYLFRLFLHTFLSFFFIFFSSGSNKSGSETKSW